VERVFLDANVLFSAAYLEHSALFRLTALKDTQLLSSAYAIEEARRNLATDRPQAVSRLNHFLTAVTTVDAPRGLELPKHIRLAPKDVPILLAAIYGKADFLLTGDLRHFGKFYGTRVAGVLVLRPAEFFKGRLD